MSVLNGDISVKLDEVEKEITICFFDHIAKMLKEAGGTFFVDDFSGATVVIPSNEFDVQTFLLYLFPLWHAPHSRLERGFILAVVEKIIAKMKENKCIVEYENLEGKWTHLYLFHLINFDKVFPIRYSETKTTVDEEVRVYSFTRIVE
jgi:hypothetical protein